MMNWYVTVLMMMVEIQKISGYRYLKKKKERKFYKKLNV